MMVLRSPIIKVLTCERASIQKFYLMGQNYDRSLKIPSFKCLRDHFKVETKFKPILLRQQLLKFKY